MDQTRKKGDPRIYIITCIFFASVVAGGVLLALYVLLPVAPTSFLLAGMVLVGIPWGFWLLGYFYACLIKPCLIRRASARDANRVRNEKEEVATTAAPGAGAAMPTPKEPPALRGAAGGSRHVQFGNVIVIGSRKENNGGGSRNSNDEDDAIRDAHRGDNRDDGDLEGGLREGCRGATDTNREESSSSSWDSEKPLRLSSRHLAS